MRQAKLGKKASEETKNKMRQSSARNVDHREWSRKHLIALNQSSEGRTRSRQMVVRRNKTEEMRRVTVARNKTPEMREASRKNFTVVMNRPEMKEKSRKNGRIVGKLPHTESQKQASRRNIRTMNSLPKTDRQRESSREQAIKLRKSGFVKQTEIEKRVLEVLLSWGVRVVPEKVFNGIGIVDFFCPDQKLCIETDGDYWHNLPGAKEKDIRKDIKLRGLGLGILRLPECLIKKQEEETLGLIDSALRRDGNV